MLTDDEMKGSGCGLWVNGGIALCTLNLGARRM